MNTFSKTEKWCQLLLLSFWLPYVHTTSLFSLLGSVIFSESLGMSAKIVNHQELFTGAGGMETLPLLLSISYVYPSLS